MSTHRLPKNHLYAWTIAVAVVGLLCGTLAPAARAALIGHWDLETGSGTTAFDQSTTGNDGTLVNTPTWQTSGLAPVPSGTTADLEFSGEVGDDTGVDTDEDYVSIPANSVYDFGASTDFSVALWIKTTATVTQNPIGQGDAANSSGGEHWELIVNDAGYLAAFIDDGTNTKYVGGPTFDSNDGPQVNDGQWHHIAVTFDRDGNAIRYIDGSAVNETVDISNVGDISNDEILAIGQRGNVGALGKTFDSPFDGRIDEVRLYDQVLTAEEVSGLAIIPEPTTLGLLSLGIASLLGRRRTSALVAERMPHRSNDAAAL
jgi:hypothetical protein